MKKKRNVFLIILVIVWMRYLFPIDYSNISKQWYKKEMVKLILELSEIAKNENSSFEIHVQNGVFLLDSEKKIEDNYFNLVSSFTHEVENLNFFSHTGIKNKMEMVKKNNIDINLIGYGRKREFVNKLIKFAKSHEYGMYISNNFKLNQFPDKKIETRIKFNDIKSFLYLINPEKYSKVDNLIEDIIKSGYKLVFIDPFFKSKIIRRNYIKKMKQNDIKIIAYMSIGEAENYRYYWKNEWNSNSPHWIIKHNENWPGGFFVKYWNPIWKKILGEYLHKIISAGFDGVIFDVVDSYEYF